MAADMFFDARARWLAWTALAAMVAACGGSVVSSGEPGGDAGHPSDGATGSDSGHASDAPPGQDAGGGAAPCSPVVLGGGTACAAIALECEYGSSPNVSCNELVVCGPGGTWHMESGGGVCALPDAGPACPTTYAAVAVRQQCAPNYLQCSYPQGTCYCTQSVGGAESVTPVWDCIPPPAGCPSARPHLGDPCSEPSRTCDYGACTGGVDLICKDGFWQQQQVPCPV